MTWRKTGSEFDDECAHVDLSDAAYRTHMEVIGYLYSVEAMDCRIPKRVIRKTVTSERAADAIRELCDHGFWAEHADAYEVQHHSDVVRQSLAAQQKQRTTSKRSSAKYRQKNADPTPEDPTSVTTGVTRHVTHDADRQTDTQLEGPTTTGVCRHNVRVQFWTCNECEQEKSA